MHCRSHRRVGARTEAFATNTSAPSDELLGWVEAAKHNSAINVRRTESLHQKIV